MKTTIQQDLLTAPSLAHSVVQCCVVTWDDLVGRSRVARVSTPRKILAFLLRQQTSLTLQDIGDMLGGRDHSTVLWWINSIKRDLASSPVMHGLVDTIKARAGEIAQTSNDEAVQQHGSSQA